MEHSNTHIHTEQTGMINFVSFILFSTGSFFHYLNEVSVSDIYNFLFKFLSIISVAMVIIINYPKAKEVVVKSYNSYKKKKTKKK